MTEFTPVISLIGGGLIGLAAVLLMAFHGRIAGMSGILTGILPPLASDWGWRAAFLIGAITAPAIIINLTSFQIPFDSQIPAYWLIVGGVTVGIGITFSSGCTSGHGVCGMARFSVRSIIATLTFMITTAITVFVIRHVLGGF